MLDLFNFCFGQQVWVILTGIDLVDQVVNVGCIVAVLIAEIFVNFDPVLPIVFVGFVPWLVGFLVYGSFTGILLSVVFQLAHVVEETSFLQAPPAPDPLQLEDEFMVHQLRTTANFATRSKLLGWWLGGLNFQVEHHLFPNISHVHYPAINGIVKQVCSEFKMPYHEHRYFVGALWSHMKHLRTLGMA